MLPELKDMLKQYQERKKRDAWSGGYVKKYEELGEL